MNATLTAECLEVPTDATSATCLECGATFRNESSLEADADRHSILRG